MKLHLGCGKRFIEGFTHMDLIDYSHVDLRCDVSLLRLDDCVAELIYASHILEYFSLTEATYVLKEWYRVLKYGGTLRLAVPDFEALIKLYQTRLDGCLVQILGPLYGRMEANGKTIYHKAVYDFKTLATMLRAAGFKAIRRWDWRETEHSYVDDCSQAYWPHMDKAQGMLLSLNMEANKV